MGDEMQINGHGPIGLAARTRASETAPAPAVDAADASTQASKADAHEALRSALAESIGGTFELDLPGADAIEMQSVGLAADVLGIELKVNVADPSVRDIARVIDQPDPVVTQGDKIQAAREQVLEAVRAGKIQIDDVLGFLESLGLLHGVARRRDERRKVMKEIVKQLQTGALTPNLIQKAKELKLERFLLEAVGQFLNRRTAAPERIDAVAAMLGAAGLRTERLEDLVIRDEADAKAVVDAARLARGTDLDQVDGAQHASVGATLLALASSARI